MTAPVLTWGMPPERKHGHAIKAFKQRLCLYGNAHATHDSWRMRDAASTYRSLPEQVRIALREAAKNGLVCDVGTHTTKDRSKYEPRRHLATIRGAMTPDVEIIATLAGFKPANRSLTYWRWYP